MRSRIRGSRGLGGACTKPSLWIASRCSLLSWLRHIPGLDDAVRKRPRRPKCERQRFDARGRERHPGPLDAWNDDEPDEASVPISRFTVLPPDPHNFDGDRNGIGAKSVTCLRRRQACVQMMDRGRRRQPPGPERPGGFEPPPRFQGRAVRGLFAVGLIFKSVSPGSEALLLVSFDRAWAPFE